MTHAKESRREKDWSAGYFAGIRAAGELLKMYGVEEGVRRIRKLNEKTDTIVVIL